MAHHDESWLFVIGYVGLAVVLSIWISLFWLVVVVGVHFLFEWVRQSIIHDRRLTVFAQALWETKLDIALVLFALALSLYMEAILGLVGLRSAGQLARAGRAGARIAGWQRAIRGILLSADDAAQLGRALVRPGNRAQESHDGGNEEGSEEAPHASRWGAWAGKWGAGDWLTAGLAIVCLALIVAAPWFTHHDWPSAISTLRAELHPLPKTH